MWCGVITRAHYNAAEATSFSRKTRVEVGGERCDAARVAFDSAELERVDHTISVACRLGVRERLVGDSLLQAGKVLEDVFEHGCVYTMDRAKDAR